MSTCRFISSLAGTGLALTSAVSAQPMAPVTATSDHSVDQAAEEYVAEAMPMDAARLERAQHGQVEPCGIVYPNTTTIIAATVHDVPVDEHQAMLLAIDKATIKQNMIAAGMPAPVAEHYADLYRNEQRAFGALPKSEQERLEKSRKSPRWRLPAYLNAIEPSPGLPHFQEPEGCGYIGPGRGAADTRPGTRFVLMPAQGRVFVIPHFSFRLCQLRKIDPYQRDICPNWVEVGDGQDAKLIGTYAYSAEWPGGRSRRAVMKFEFDGSPNRKVELRAPPADE